MKTNQRLSPRFLLEDTGGEGYWFDTPSSYWEAHNKDEISQALLRIENVCRQGEYVLALLPYDLGLALQDLPGQKSSDPIFLRAWSFPHLQTWSAKDIETFLKEETGDTPPSGLINLEPRIDFHTYCQAIDQVHQAIRKGETYQLNYTFPFSGLLYGSPLSVYQQLRARQPGPYSAYIELESGWVLSHSPESFIEHRSGQLTCRPMKGTSDRMGTHPLSQDPKNRSENVMIVDLIRNDLSRISYANSVEVSNLFSVYSYGEVSQMISTIMARLYPRHSLESILRAMFPCGSVTGAPKRRTMQWINQLESFPRGLYCGSIGWFKPCTPEAVPDFHLSVAIRTLEINSEFQVTMGIGSGITIESDAAQEWKECQLKASFATHLPSSVGLFETMRSEQNQITLWKVHCRRLEMSARALGIPFSPIHAQDLIRKYLAALDTSTVFRVRLDLSSNGQITLTSEPLIPMESSVDLVWASELGCGPISSKNALLGHKVNDRVQYEQASVAAQQHGAFDALFVNEHGKVTEGSRSNIFVRHGDRWKTPPLKDGVLPGIYRGLILSDPSITIDEVSLVPDDVDNADEIWVTNALRGKMLVRGFRTL